MTEFLKGAFVKRAQRSTPHLKSFNSRFKTYSLFHWPLQHYQNAIKVLQMFRWLVGRTMNRWYSRWCVELSTNLCVLLSNAKSQGTQLQWRLEWQSITPLVCVWLQVFIQLTSDTGTVPCALSVPRIPLLWRCHMQHLWCQTTSRRK